MATISVLPAMNAEKDILSFFGRAQNALVDAEQANAHTTKNLATLDGTDERDSKSGLSDENTAAGLPRKAQRTLKQTFHTHSRPALCGPSIETETPAGISEAHPDAGPPKRRRISSDDSRDPCLEASPALSSSLVPPVINEQAREKQSRMRQSSPEVVIPAPTFASNTIAHLADSSLCPKPATPPRKMLKLNGSGTLGSPRAKIAEGEEQEVKPKKRGRRPKKMILKLSYQPFEHVGRKIDEILDNRYRHPSSIQTAPKKEPVAQKKENTKPPHPFFMPKPKEPTSSQRSSLRKASAVTPGKLRRQTMNQQSVELSTRVLDIHVSALLKDRLIARHPGAAEPAWPSRDNVHIRGLEEDEVKTSGNVVQSASSYSSRKRKAARRPFPQEQSLLGNFFRRLIPEVCGAVRPDGFCDPHPSLRLPQQLNLFGAQVAEITMQHLTNTAGSIDDINSYVYHPSIKKLLQSVHRDMDLGTQTHSGGLAWVQKYAPTAAAEVLQPTIETTALKDWLASSAVSSVSSTVKPQQQQARAVLDMKKRAKRSRKLKAADLDDFIVDDDEILGDITGHDDNERDRSLPNSQSVIGRLGNGEVRHNVILLCGPPGCGKTASAYAIAKELGFKVFEINAGERRTGKDVLDRIGDMTENHLVRHHGLEAEEISTTEVPDRFDEVFERDLATGRQGTMNAFFKPKAQVKTTFKASIQPTKSQVLREVQETAKKASKEQQQSLILLEEVDILFKEDKDFWSTVCRLSASSRRPIIMTCNTEPNFAGLDMNFPAAFYFQPPAQDLAIDYLLCVAAAEGHLLERESIVALYEANAHDFRASLTELNFWCQFGVGDPREGLSWIHPRVPDQEGRSTVLVSQGTYQKHMGHLPERDLDQVSQLVWMHQQYNIEVSDVLNEERDTLEAKCAAATSLQQMSDLAESLSMIDFYAGNYDQPVLDTTQHDMTEKARSQYVDGIPLLQTDEETDFTGILTELFMASTLSAYQSSGVHIPSTLQSNLERAITSTATRTQLQEPQLTRRDFTCFDAISDPPNYSSSSNSMMQSVFDGTFETIVLDIAPYVRSIVRYENLLAERRKMLYNAVMRQETKRSRTTRAARSALEGSQRETMRRERWFPKELKDDAALATGGVDWPVAVAFDEFLPSEGTLSRDGTEAPMSSLEPPKSSLESN